VRPKIKGWPVCLLPGTELSFAEEVRQWGWRHGCPMWSAIGPLYSDRSLSRTSLLNEGSSSFWSTSLSLSAIRTPHKRNHAHSAFAAWRSRCCHACGSSVRSCRGAVQTPPFILSFQYSSQRCCVASPRVGVWELEASNPPIQSGLTRVVDDSETESK
jgi:hypothetical protein